MKKINIGKKPFLYPMPMSIVGAIVDKKPNFLTVGWVIPVNYNPAMIGIALGKTHYTNQGIKQEKAFSVNIPGTDLLKKTDYCGLVSGKNVDKSNLFNVFYEERQNIPLIADCPICIQCKLVETVDLPSNEFFIGEVINTYANEDCLVDNKPDISKVSPFTLTMPDNNFWSIGKQIGKAWSIGKDYR